MPIAPSEAIVISLCDRTGNMVRPWADAGWLCYCVDLQHPRGERREGNIIFVGADLLRWMPPRYRVKIVFGFPPCTNLAVSGSKWFRGKGIPGLCDGLNVFARAVELAEWIGAPYMIENPVAVISTHYRKPDVIWQPHHYAGYLTDKVERESERYEKKTCLWTGHGFKMPPRKSLKINHPKGRSPLHMLSPSEDRGDIRSITPKGFSLAVYLANCNTDACEGSTHQR